MNAEYVKRALCFHGQPMQKMWENERGANDLQNLGLPIQVDYSIYQSRQRYFTFQDRAKRLKLHQFLAKKANDLYDSELQKYANIVDENHLEKVKPFYATLPPYELFAHNPNDKISLRWHAVLEGINPGDIMYGIVIKIITNGSLTIKPMCTAEPRIRYLNHLPIKALILQHDVGPMPTEADGKVRGYHVNDFVCCEVLRVLVDVDRIFLSMTGTPKNAKIKFGLVNRDDMPLYYTISNDNATKRYEECMMQSREILNPNYDVLFSINGLDVNDNFTLMNALKRPFPEDEFAKNLRKSQANKWAFRAVAEGIERFKSGMHMEAFQCLNKALSIDPSNVEGLVARGALFANRGSFQKAVDDFKTALELNKFHANARKYMGETLVALGRSLEDDKRFEEAGKAYMDCLEIIPQHAQALECLERLNQRTIGNGNNAGILDNELLEHLLSLAAPTTLTTTPANGNELDKKGAEKISESSEDSSSDSEDSNTDSETLNAPANSNLNFFPVQTNKFKKDASLSPLSKRMALHAASLQAAAAPKPLNTSLIQYDQPFYYNLAQSTAATGSTDFKLDDDDTATRVRKLIEEASQHKKAKKKKTKQKKTKKSKKPIEKDDMEISGLAGSLFQNNYLQEAFKTVGSNNIKQKLDMDISTYEQKIADIKSRQAKLLGRSFTETPLQLKEITIEDSPPPPPSMKLPAQTLKSSLVNLKQSETTSNTVSFGIASKIDRQAVNSRPSPKRDMLSFQIRKPVKTDILGMVRIATPLVQHSRSRSYSPSRRDGSRSTRRRSRSRGSDRDRRHNRRSRSRSRSGSRRRRRRYKSRTRSRSRSRHNRRHRTSSRSRSKSRPRRRSRSRSRDRRRSSSRPKETARIPVWQRLGHRAPGATVADAHSKQFKFGNITTNRSNYDDGPTIEEIDEIINEAQRERKAEIIKRDRDILKKPARGRF